MKGIDPTVTHSSGATHFFLPIPDIELVELHPVIACITGKALQTRGQKSAAT